MDTSIEPQADHDLQPEAVSTDCARLKNLERMFCLISLLAPLRRGAELADLHCEVSEAGHTVSRRTVYRDLCTLERMGLVESDPDQRGIYACRRWRWLGFGRRAELLAKVAEAYAASITSEVGT